jgi:hypothetical protein
MAKSNTTEAEATEAAAVTTEAAAVTTEAAAVTTEAAAVTTEAAAVTTEAAAVTTEAAAVTTEAAAVTTEAAAAEEVDLVVAVVKKRYSIMLDSGLKVTFEPGNVTMPREQAEHWYSKANGTVIVGVPDNGTANGAGAQFTLKRIVESLTTAANEISTFGNSHTGLTDSQKDKISKASKLAADAAGFLVDL